MSVLVLERFGYMPFGTYGKLMFPTGEEFYTVERPWMDNQANVSCIPEGEYILGLRFSMVVKKTTGGEFKEGWEVLNVPDRTYIMLHPGNWPTDTQGCIAIGCNLVMLARGVNDWLPAVSDSRRTFKKVMALLDQGGEWDLHITHKCIKPSQGFTTDTLNTRKK